MTNNDIKQFAAIMKSLAINAGVELSGDVLRLYKSTLNNFTIEQIEDGAKKVLLTWKYTRMPPLAVLVENINGSSIKIEDTALVIANQIIAHLKMNGSSVFPPSLDDTAKHLMNTRWPYYSWGKTLIESEEKWWIKEFCEAYRAYSETGATLQIEADEDISNILRERNQLESVGGTAYLVACFDNECCRMIDAAQEKEDLKKNP